ncbi:25515_t:CDS:2, partial [Gigaspora margarita]
TTSTSRIEGVHAILKTYLQIFIGDLHQVCITILLAVANQKKEIDTITESELPQIKEDTSHSEDPLQLLLQDLQQRYQEWTAFQQSVIQNSLKDMINTPLITLQNPNMVSTKGCPSNTTNCQQTNSTRRDPSGFEYIEYK